MNDRVTCEAVMAAFVDTEQLGNQQLFDEVAKQMGIPDEVRHASAPVGRAGKRYKLFERLEEAMQDVKRGPTDE